MEYPEEILSEKMTVICPDAVKVECKPNRKKGGIILIDRLHNPDGTGVFPFKGFKRDKGYFVQEGCAGVYQNLTLVSSLSSSNIRDAGRVLFQCNREHKIRNDY